MRVPLATALGALAVVAGGAAVPATAAPATRASVSVMTTPGQTAAVAARLRARGYAVNRRVGRRLQVVVRGSGARRSLSAIRGIAAVTTPPAGYGDAVIGQGLDRTGASALADVAGGGAGLRIAVLDMGFGTAIAALQARGELPPAVRLQTRSFDPAGGLAGTNAYGNPTDHGELVAQTVYDYAPRARYLFVNYHTQDDFVTAANWLAGQRVDIVVHSNNFLDGPFDGTSAMARAVDRVAAAGVLWFNSAGNYGEKHWAGSWSDPDGDGVLDWPAPWTVRKAVGEALTFHLSWRNPPGAPRADVDLRVERRDGDAWVTVASSLDRQVDGMPPAERIAGVRVTVAGEYRLRALLASGPPPAGDLHLYAREDDLIGWTGTGAGSIPTPADAAGSVSVGAVDWRSNSLVRYSSLGPTADGRNKPDLVAPTGTRLSGSGGDPRDVGGTSIAAPNAAGAAAAMIAAMRGAGLAPGPAAIRAHLVQDAVDLGAPGTDGTFGAGRVRVDVEPPVLRPVEGPRRPVRDAVRVSVDAIDAGPVATWAMRVNGVVVRQGRVARERINARTGVRSLPDGAHTVALDVGDAVGNVSRRTWRFVKDATPPEIAELRAPVGPRRRIPIDGRPRVRFPVFVVPRVADARGGSVAVAAVLIRIPGGVRGRNAAVLPSGGRGVLPMGPVPAGRYILRVTGTDAAGNVGVRTEPLTVGLPVSVVP